MKNQIIRPTLAGGFSRAPLMEHDRTESANLLGNLKAKLNRGQRKALHLARSNRITNDESPTPRAEPVRLALKLRTLTLHQLIRRRAQFARKSATGKYILAKLGEYSILRPKVVATQNANLAAFGQVEAEIEARMLAVAGRLAETRWD